ncbi:Adenosylcobinamide amidohydrolase [Paenibacillus sp. UNC496MF]|uniref:adenosylcobinamide amidohydrolase n=1 Tax=Paenibacillus sp. UNC496MF TaxID=1502753 RepID=UPI0008EFEA02|nr:adenosylcobinamide amidohydrolase [Paenibacillus sp. UNC496MF]SFI51311.1 Adenosylcobinamide amidohydrolase [Paenibacillus sp. UNC496MF]
MTQPFRTGSKTFASTICPGMAMSLAADRLVIETEKPFYVLSSAVYGGGYGTADRFVNREVPLDYDCSDPARDYERMLALWGYSPETTIGFLTAAKLTHASVAETAGEAFGLLCCATAGTGNAARAGRARETFPAYAPGTINLFVLVDGSMTASAMVNAVITATEAKSAALHDCGILDQKHGLPATGTTTDAIAIGASQTGRHGRTHRYAGAATALGDAIGRLVYGTVEEAVRTQGEA